ncbi:MAG: hypothetical protein AAFO82_20440 [Bacteroidota bacterium]
METTTKSKWQQLLLKNRLEELFEALHEHTKTINAKNWEEEVLLQQSRYNNLQKAERSGTLDYEKITQQQMQINQSLLSIIGIIPLDKATQKKQQKALKNNLAQFKKRLFHLLLFSKATIALIIVFYWAVSAYTVTESTILILLLLPVLIFYTQTQNKTTSTTKPIHLQPTTQKRSLSSYVFFGFYILTWIALLPLYPKGEFGEFEGLTKLLLVLIFIEIGLSYYLGKILTFITTQ